MYVLECDKQSGQQDFLSEIVLKNNLLSVLFMIPFRRLSFLVFPLLILTVNPFQLEAQTTVTIPQSLSGVGRSYRSLSMGNTGIASANDSSALFYNPAVLANVEGWWFDYASWSAEGTQEFPSEDAGLIMASTTFPYINRDGLSETNKANFLAVEDAYLRGNASMTLTANIMSEGFTIAGTYMLENSIASIDSGNYIYQRDDLIRKYGLSIPLGLGQLVVGLSRSDISRKEALDASVDTVTNWGEESLGTGYDVGILYRMANKGRITWGLVAYNVGGTEFGTPDQKVEQTYGLGVSMNHELGIFRIVPAIDIRDIGSTGERANTVHAGLEIGLFPNSTGGSYLSYRVGYNQGYSTTGFELNLFNRYIVLGYANYGEEVGTVDEPKENRRTIYYFSLGF